MSFARSRRFFMVAIAFLLVVIHCNLPVTLAQEMHHDGAKASEGAKASLSAGALTISCDDQMVTLTPDKFKTLARKTITVRNGHTNTDETYSGVLLSVLLTQAGAPLGTKLHGKALANYVLATGSDGYQAIYSIAEIDPDFHSGDVIVADTVNGKPLEDGPFKMVNTEDKHPARWVRNLVSIKLVAP